MFDYETTCEGCGAVTIKDATAVSAPCVFCAAAAADQGSQLGIFEMAPTAPARNYRAPMAPKNQGGLFS